MIYRSELNRPMTWVELDDNFREVAKIPAQTASDVAASQKAVADAKLEASKSQQASRDALASAERSEAAAKANANIVAACMAPFPDVWIPFSSNLRMTEGVGGDVRVGDVTVANMVNFERSTTATYIDKSGVLRTAAINEPRFERQGLLIEGQSTNLIEQSETYSPIVAGGTTSVEKLKIGGFNFVKQVNSGSGGGGNAVTVSSTFDIKTGDRFTFSCVFKLPDAGESAGRFRLRVGFTGGFAFDISFYNELSMDREPTPVSMTKTQPFSDKSLVKVTVQYTATNDYAGAFLQLQQVQQQGVVIVGACQLEALPFASSYIPTSGSAVTRAADRPKIDAANYANDNTRDITIHVTADTMQTPTQRAEYPRVMNCLTPANMFLSFGVYPDNQWDCYAGLGAGTSTQKGSKPEMPSQMGFVVKNGKARAFINGAFGSEVTSVAAPIGDIGFSSDSRPLWGHIRNFRIWHRALTDEQIKCLK